MNKKGKKQSDFFNGWQKVEKSGRYRIRQIVETRWNVTDELKDELIDGIFLLFNSHDEDMSYKAQRRLMRRIVEKRHAQRLHQRIGRTADKFLASQTVYNISRCIRDIDKLCACA